MAAVPQLLFFCIIGLFAITSCLCLIYCIPMLAVRQFHSRGHILTFNLGLIILIFGIIHIVFFTLRFHYSKILLNDLSCNMLTYIRVMITFQLSFAPIAMSAHRLGCVVYHAKRYFGTRKWFLTCVSCQWLLGFVLSLVLFLSKNEPSCHPAQWVSIYVMLVIIVVCPVISLLVNLRIFIYGRASSRRMQLSLIFNRVQPAPSRTSIRADLVHRPRMSRRDVRLLKHTICTFLIFFIGWSPIYTAMIFARHLDVSTFKFGFLCVWGEVSLVGLVVNMFIYNDELRRYLGAKLFQTS